VTARRIERDQHDGVQQHLIALMAAIETARHTQGPTQASVSLNAARDVGQGAVVELRSVISGILPPVLADGGLVAAVRARAGQLPPPVIVKVGDGAQARCPARSRSPPTSATAKHSSTSSDTQTLRTHASRSKCPTTG
jgi:signal transduction histidine kinase